MNKTILSKLGDYLLAHREEIVDEWLRAAEQNPDITSLGHLKDKEELTDHLPELCQNLAKLLKSPQSDQSRTQVSRAARVHGRHRWQQGWLDAYARKAPKLDGETRRAAENIIHQALDDVIRDSAAQFVEEQLAQLKATSHLNSQLADTLAEVRQQKGAAEAAKTTKKRKRPRR